MFRPFDEYLFKTEKIDVQLIYKLGMRNWVFWNCAAFAQAFGMAFRAGMKRKAPLKKIAIYGIVRISIYNT